MSLYALVDPISLILGILAGLLLAVGIAVLLLIGREINSHSKHLNKNRRHP